MQTDVAEIGAKPGTATRSRGRKQARKILLEARNLLIFEGIGGLTVRRVASNLGISLGNLTYYFPNKDALLRALIADLLMEYDDALERERERFPNDPGKRFLAYLDYLIADCKKPDTRGVFFQIWSLATHSGVVHELRDEMYADFHAKTCELLRPLNPTINRSELSDLATTVIAMLEGLHVILDLDRNVMELSRQFERRFRESICRLALPQHRPAPV